MQDDKTYTRRFSDVYLKELEYVRNRRSNLGGLDVAAIEQVREGLGERLAQDDTGEATQIRYEPPPRVLTEMAGGENEAPFVVTDDNLSQQLAKLSARGPVGLALSGGGIRSATFNLGLLQALARKGVLRFCDYLSTVSGGGYIGSCLTSLLDDPEASVEYDGFPFRFDRKVEPDERKEVKWLRRHGKYLVPNTSLFGLDIWRMVGVQVSGIALTNIVTLAFVLLLGLAIHEIHEVAKGPQDISWFQHALFKVAGVALVLLVIIRGIGSLWNLSMSARKIMRGMMALFTVLSAGCAFAGLVILLGRNLATFVHLLKAWLPGVSIASAAGLIAGLLESENKTVKKLLGGVFRFGWVILLPVLFAWILKILWENRMVDDGLPHLAIFGMPWELLAAFGLLILGCFVNTNRISGHHFYRDRLSEAYIIKRVREQIVSNEPLALSELHRHPNGSPYHLVNTTLNVHGSKSRYLRGRGAEIFEFAKFYSGSNSTGYCASGEYERGGTRLATVMSVSGAAASPQMGTMTNRFLAFLMTLLNVRLNGWMPNPEQAVAPRLKLWPYYFVKELFGTSKETDRLLNLSDGGHYENLGLYGLIKRGCRFIIVSDAAADPGFGFGDFASLQRKVRIDLGVGIEIDMSGIRPDEDGLSRRHFAAGTIHYPSGAKGVLVYIKTSLTGDESEDLLAYRRRNPSFPDQSTADQFFDEAQFESYRKLGDHVGNGIFEEQDSH